MSSQVASKREPRPFYMGLPFEVYNRIAKTYSEGVKNYDPSVWERFYQKEGRPEDFLKMFDHAQEHIFKAYDEIVNGKLHAGLEDHLAHAVVNLCMIMWATENGLLPNKLIVESILNQKQVEEITDPVEEVYKQYNPETEETPQVSPEENPSKSLLKLFGLNKG